MSYLFLILSISFSDFLTTSNTPDFQDGIYTYDVAFAEFDGESLCTTCIVVIKGNTIKVMNNGSMSGDFGDTIEEGTIMKHKSGKWIIASSNEDVGLDEIGGCSDGPRIIDFKNMKFWTC